MLLIIHSITSAEIDEKTKTGILLDRSLCCFFSLIVKKKKERGTHTRNKKENQTLIQKRKSEINKQQEYACREKDVCVENK